MSSGIQFLGDFACEMVARLQPPQARHASVRPLILICLVTFDATAAAYLMPDAMRTGWRHRQAARLPPVRCEVPSFEVVLTKPLGIAIETCANGEGVEVGQILEGGSAYTDGQLWKGDLVLAVNGVDVRDADFDAVMDLLTSSPDSCAMLVGRERGKVAALQLQDGRLVFATPGSAMSDAAKEHGIECQYTCMKGTCGTCSLFLKDNEDEAVRPVLMCKASFPVGEDASLMPYELLGEDSPEAQEYKANLEMRLAEL